MRNRSDMFGYFNSLGVDSTKLYEARHSHGHVHGDILLGRTDNGKFTVNYKAEPRGDKIVGIIVANFGGQEREMPFEGARAAKPKDDA